MMFDSFRHLSSAMQLQWVLRYGTYLASRCEQASCVNLYYCADAGRGFFVELTIEPERLLHLRSFTTPDLLEVYVPGNWLPVTL